MVSMLKKHRRIFFSFGLLVLVVVGFITYKSTKRSPELIRAPQRIDDYELLKKNQGDASAQGMALLRLANSMIPEGQDEALRRIGNQDPRIRRIAAQALSYYPFEGSVREGLMKLSKDADARVRGTVLESIVNRVEPSRIQFLSDYINRSGITGTERLQTYFGLFQLTSDSNSKKKYFEEIFRAASLEVPPQGAIPLLIRIGDNNNEVLALLAGRLSAALHGKKLDEGIVQMLPTIYRYLLQRDPGGLKPMFSKSALGPFQFLRVSALTTVADLCPVDRYDVLKRILTEKKYDESSKNAALTGLSKLGGKRSVFMMKDIKSEALATRIRALTTELGASGKMDLCQTRKSASLH